MNAENKTLFRYLTKNPKGIEIAINISDVNELEEKIRELISLGDIAWDFEDNEDEGIDWVTFDDLFNDVRKYFYGR